MTFKTKEEEEQYDKWSKKQIYVAYLGENAARKQSEKSFNKLISQEALMRYDRDKFMDKWLRLHIEKNVKIVGDMDTTLDEYFSDPTRRVFFTPSGGYYCTVQHEQCVFIMFAWANIKKAKAEYKDMPDLIKHIQSSVQMPLRYVGVNNVMKNHSVDLGDGLFELKL